MRAIQPVDVENPPIFQISRIQAASCVAHETRISRSLLKMAAYRVSVTALLAGITFYYTGNMGETGIIAVVFNVGGAFLYYGYERLWDAVTWGKM